MGKFPRSSGIEISGKQYVKKNDKIQFMNRLLEKLGDRGAADPSPRGYGYPEFSKNAWQFMRDTYDRRGGVTACDLSFGARMPGVSQGRL